MRAGEIKLTGHDVPIRTQAQALRQGRSCAPAPIPGFLPVDDDATLAQAGTRGSWRQADVKRAIVAAEKAGLRAYRIELAPDGTISIVVGAWSEEPSG